MSKEIHHARATVFAAGHGRPTSALTICWKRELYISQLIKEGRFPNTFSHIFFTLTAIERHLQLKLPRVTLDQIEAAAEEWAMTTHRSAKCRHIGKRFFVFDATIWMRLLGRFQEQPAYQPFEDKRKARASQSQSRNGAGAAAAP